MQDHTHTVAASEQSAVPDPEASQTVESLPLQQQQQQQQQQAISSWQYEKGCWEAFHARDNATARFYKERRSVSAALPTALRIMQAVTHVCVEICCPSKSLLFEEQPGLRCMVSMKGQIKAMWRRQSKFSGTAGVATAARVTPGLWCACSVLHFAWLCAFLEHSAQLHSETASHVCFYSSVACI